MAALALASVAGASKAQNNNEEPFNEASVFLELNDTDGDLGLQAFIDGEPWKRLEIEGPNDKPIFQVRVSRNLAQQGLNEIFFESAEPGFDELPPDEFLARFPEGTYEASAKKLGGGELENDVQITHLLPAAPSNLAANGQQTPLDCEVEAPPNVGTPVTISWDAVTLSHPTIGRINEPIDVDHYEVTVEIEDLSNAVFTIELGPDQTSVDVPGQLLALADEFKLGVLVEEASGNRTVIESCFAK
ncbi:MAG: hypothetical protein ACR2QH_15915 [Geminicoccaceae bacterium]